MKNKTILGLLLIVCAWGVTANAVQSATTCDRECLRGKVTQLLYAFVKHDVSGLPVADTLRQNPRGGSIHENPPAGEAQRRVGVAPGPLLCALVNY